MSIIYEDVELKEEVEGVEGAQGEWDPDLDDHPIDEATIKRLTEVLKKVRSRPHRRNDMEL